MQAMYGTLVGGLLAIAGGLLVAVSADRRQRSRWRHDTQLRVGSELLGALQLVVRRLRDFAVMEEKSYRQFEAAADAYHEATMRWNTAMYATLMASPVTSADLI